MMIETSSSPAPAGTIHVFQPLTRIAPSSASYKDVHTVGSGFAVSSHGEYLWQLCNSVTAGEIFRALEQAIQEAYAAGFSRREPRRLILEFTPSGAGDIEVRLSRLRPAWSPDMN